ncbi:trefoil factor 3-like [Dugong dugon]
MEARALRLLAMFLALGFSRSAGEYVGLSGNQCAVPAKDRVDCGYPQVTEQQCNHRGCCFDSSIPEVPWCFKPLQETGPEVETLGIWEAVHCHRPPEEAHFKGFMPRAAGGQRLSPSLTLPRGLCNMQK